MAITIIFYFNQSVLFCETLCFVIAGDPPRQVGRNDTQRGACLAQLVGRVIRDLGVVSSHPPPLDVEVTEKENIRGAWVAQLVGHPTLDIGSLKRNTLLNINK